MTRKSVLEPCNTNVWRAGLRLTMREVHRSPDSDWRECAGFYQHPLGIVEIWQGWSVNGDTAWSSMEVVDRNGFVHLRQWSRVHPRNTVSRLARTMIEELL